MSTAEEELLQCAVQVRARGDPATAGWVPSNKVEVDSAQCFVAEKLLVDDYALLQLAALRSAYAMHSLTVGLCGVSTEHIVKGREDGEQFIFPGLERILALAEPYLKNMV